jgi:hypothetical protein
MTYKLIKSPITNKTCGVYNIDTKTSIPMIEDNTDYQAYLKWVSEGGVPLPADE